MTRTLVSARVKRGLLVSGAVLLSGQAISAPAYDLMLGTDRSASLAAGTVAIEQRPLAHGDVAMMQIAPIGSFTGSSLALMLPSDLVVWRLDNLAMANMPGNMTSLGDTRRSAPTERETGTVARATYGKSASLPEPDGWSAVLATLALGVFFFLRRIV